MSNSATLWTVACQAPLSRLLHPLVSPGNDTGVGYHALLQGIFPTQSDSGPINLTGPQHPTRDLGTLAATAIIPSRKRRRCRRKKNTLRKPTTVEQPLLRGWIRPGALVTRGADEGLPGPHQGVLMKHLQPGEAMSHPGGRLCPVRDTKWSSDVVDDGRAHPHSSLSVQVLDGHCAAAVCWPHVKDSSVFGQRIP